MQFQTVIISGKHMKKAARWIIFLALIVAEMFSTYLIIEKSRPAADRQAMQAYMH